jgi:lipoprotein-releasing system permease protein
MATALVEAYPVKMQLQDFILTGVAIFIITLLVSIRPARTAAATDVRDNI